MLRRLPETTEVPGPMIRAGGRDLVCLSSNNYLGLATHPQVIERAIASARRSGVGATGSRLLSGNLAEHSELENELAQFKGAPTTLLFNSGYTANLAILTALAGEGDLLVCDKLNHASLIDGARACGAEVRYYRHGALERADELLSKKIGGRKFLVSDSVFSMDGDIANLPELLRLSRTHDATLILDEAHSTGVLGATGRGIFEHFAVMPENVPIIQMGTLSKALGGFGAFVACTHEVRDQLINRARPLIYSTALPPPVLGAALGALQVLRETPSLLVQLRANAHYFRESLARLGYTVSTQLETPITPIMVGEPQAALDMATRLGDLGVLAQAVRPPSVPVGTSRIRATVMATHTRAQLDLTIAAFREMLP